MKRFLLSISVVLLPVLSFGQYRDSEVYKGLYDSETGAAMREHVAELSAAVMEGRKAGSAGERDAAAYLAAKFNEYGVDLLSARDGDRFGIRSDAGDTLTSQNIIG